MSTALVLLMTPALAFFYGGLVRSKNSLNTMMMSYVALGFIGILWALVAYSLAFSEGSPWLGGFSNALLNGVDLAPKGTIPHLLFMAYQGTFAIITAALISGADRGAHALLALHRRSSRCGCCVVYAPVAHWVWGGGWLGDPRRARLRRRHRGAHQRRRLRAGGRPRARQPQGLRPPGDPAAQRAVRAARRRAPLVRLVRLQRRQRPRRQCARPALAFTNTFLAPMATMVVWAILDSLRTGHVTAVGGATGIVVGLVAITPAAGFVSPHGRARTRRHRGVPQLLRHPLPRPHAARRFARRLCRPRHRRPHGRAAHRRLRREGMGRHRRAAGRQSCAAGQAGARAPARRSSMPAS